jgi:hypothetical protein
MCFYVMRRDDLTFIFTLCLGYILEVKFSKFDRTSSQLWSHTPSTQASCGQPVHLIFYDPLAGLIPIIASVSKNSFKF